MYISAIFIFIVITNFIYKCFFAQIIFSTMIKLNHFNDLDLNYFY